MRFLAGTATAAIMAVSSAYAADLGLPMKSPVPPAPEFSWTGCHAGINLGLGTGQALWTDTVADGNIDNDLLAATTRTAHLDLLGGTGGGQVGCDMQLSRTWVVGIGASLNGSLLGGTGMDQFNSDWTLHDNVDWYGTVTGRVGAAVVNDVLIYAKGGLAFAHNNFEIENSGVTLGTPSDIRLGWTLGVGVDWAFSPNWSAFVEAAYYGFSSQTETFNNPVAVAGGFVDPPFTINVQPSFETVTFGVNYRFSW
jgi:outer membrane immunogenic protein